MASDSTTTAPVANPADADKVENPTNEQDINPWSVTGAQDDSGEVAAIDYINLSKYGARRPRAQCPPSARRANMPATGNGPPR